MKSISLKLAIGATVLGLAIGCGGGGETPKAPSAPKAPAAEAPAAEAPAANAGATGTASVTGTVKFEGEAPNLKTLDMSSDAYCGGAHADGVKSEALVLGEGNTMGNVIVSVVAGEGYAAPADAAVLDQKGCVYHPHVLSVMAGQPVKILNSDDTMHNVHTMPKVNKAFNEGMPPVVKEKDTVFESAEDPFKVKCDVHPWMESYVGVYSHPFHTVTAADGAFTIEGLAAGTYTVVAWHEKMGAQEMEITVEDGGSATADFSFSK